MDNFNDWFFNYKERKENGLALLFNRLAIGEAISNKVQYCYYYNKTAEKEIMELEK